MRIGILAPVGVESFLEYFDDLESQLIIRKNSRLCTASAVISLAKGFISEGHFVRLFTLCNSHFYIKSPQLEIVGVKRNNNYFIRNSLRTFVDASSIDKALSDKTEDLDVLHAHWTYEFAFAAKDYANQLPIFCTVRDYAPYIWKIESLKNKVAWLFKYIMNEMVFQSQSIHFVANSPYTQSLIKKRYNIDAPIIPNPIKGSFLKNNNPIDKDQLCVLCVSSSLDRRKNLDTLLKAFQELLIHFPSALLVLVGTPFSLSNPIVQRWGSQGLLQSVRLIGGIKHDDLIQYYDEASVFVTPSLEETFGNTLLEAMARKVPIVAGESSGAIPYVLREGKAGFLCDVSNVSSLVETISYVFNNKESSINKVNWAFDLLENEYLDSQVCEKHLELYRKFL